MNMITPTYMTQLGFKMGKIHVDAQKIDRSLLKTYNMIITAFQVFDKFGCFLFFWDFFIGWH